MITVALKPAGRQSVNPGGHGGREPGNNDGWRMTLPITAAIDDGGHC
jgi:hypothetical protein